MVTDTPVDGCETTNAGCARVGTGTRFTEPEAVDGNTSFGAGTSAADATGAACTFLSVAAEADCKAPSPAARA
jgi:hypothetical protein